MKQTDDQSKWIEVLADFLKRTPAVEAVRLNEEQRSLEIATLGEVDLQALRDQLAETLNQVSQQATGGGSDRD